MSDGAVSDAESMLGVFSLDVTPSEPSHEKKTPLRSDIPARHGQQHNKQASVVDYDDEDEQLNSDLQLVFDQNAQVGRQSSWLYEKVAVLLISWDGSCDDLNTEGEVDGLARMFRETYNYKVQNVKLNCNGCRLAQVQVNKRIADFVYDEDGPSTLLIVYYAGHGLTKRSERSPTIEDPATVVWNFAEAALQQTKGDIFEIFDCCYAGDLGRGSGGRGFGTRCFEFLGATSSGATTKAPGKDSFSSGLIWALDVLAKESDRFTTSTLANKIREAPNFPKRQVPILYERNDLASLQRIVIAPLLKGDEASMAGLAEKYEMVPHQLWGFLDLRIGLERRPKRTEIEKFAKDVSVMMQSTELKVRHVKWGGLYRPLSTDVVHSPMVRKAVRTLLDMGRRRRRPSPTSIPAPFCQSSPGTLSPESAFHTPTLAQPHSARTIFPVSPSGPSSLRHAAHYFGDMATNLHVYFQGTSQTPQSPDRSQVTKDEAWAKLENNFDVNDKVWLRNPATGWFTFLMYVVEKRYDNNKPGWEYKLKDSWNELYKKGQPVEEIACKGQLEKMPSLEPFSEFVNMKDQDFNLADISQMFAVWKSYVDECPNGYPKLAGFMDSEDTFGIYRRFGFLYSRVLLSKQDELRRLEDDLDAMDKRDAITSDKTRKCLKSRAKDFARTSTDGLQTRKELIGIVESKLYEYGQMILQAQQLVSLNKPADRDHLSVQNFLENGYKDNDNDEILRPLMEADSEFIYRKEDLVTLRPGRESAWLDAFVERLLKIIRCKPVQYVFCSKETRLKSDNPHIQYYTKQRVDRLVTLIISGIMLILLVVPTYALYRVTNMKEASATNATCIGILLVATLIFSAVLSLFTKAKRHEILGASAAYCAVLVVFIGNVSGVKGGLGSL
ncbi:MAG: hypothetical protein Q9209_000506 [Squamulea sp. 1 TL-2023]